MILFGAWHHVRMEGKKIIMINYKFLSFFLENKISNILAVPLLKSKNHLTVKVLYFSDLTTHSVKIFVIYNKSLIKIEKYCEIKLYCFIYCEKAKLNLNQKQKNRHIQWLVTKYISILLKLHMYHYHKILMKNNSQITIIIKQHYDFCTLKEYS